MLDTDQPSTGIDLRILHALQQRLPVQRKLAERVALPTAVLARAAAGPRRSVSCAEAR
jgi:hypothetical protein